MFPTKTSIDPATSSRLRFLRVASTLFVATVIPVLLVIGLFALSLGSPAAIAEELGPDAPGSIAGVVRDQNGAFLPNITVTLYRRSPYSWVDWIDLRAVTTASDGAYYFTVLPVGNYRIGLYDPTGRHAPRFYSAAPTIDKAADITVAGNQINAIDLVLSPGGQITGVVSATTSFSMTTGTVMLYQELKQQGLSYWSAIQSVQVSPDNDIYTFTNLSADRYRICASGSGALLATYECYDNVYDVNRAAFITLTGSATISNVNIVLGDSADYGQISGRVSGINQEPLANIEIHAIRDQAQPFVQAANPMLSRSATDSALASSGYPSTRTDSQGYYRFANLVAGNYRLLFRDPSGAYAFEYYHDSGLAEGATLVPLADRQNVTGIDAQLSPGGHIRGLVTIAGRPAPLRMLQVQVKTPFGWQFVTDRVDTSADGQYNTGGLPAGIYRLWASASITDLFMGYSYHGYYFTPGAENSDFDFASGNPFTEIALGIGETKTANIALLGGPMFEGSLSGRITAGGAPLAGAKVLLYPKDMTCCTTPGQPMVSVFTDATGRYTINGLTSMAFYLGVSDPTGLYATTYYTAHVAPMTANALYVEDGQALTNIDFDLPLAGAISGHVTQPDGQPVPDLLVTISVLTQDASTGIANRQLFSEVRTDAAGRYTLKGLHPGDYNVCFQDTRREYTKCYGMLWWVYNPEAGRVTVAAGATTTDIDVRWGPDLKNYLPIIAR